MTILLFVSILMAIIPVVIVTWRRGELPESISAMVYELPEKWQWLWSVWIWAVMFTFAPVLMNALEGSIFQFVGFITLASLVFVGAMPLFDTESHKYHYPLAYAAGIGSQICVLVICPWWILCWIPMVVLILACMAGVNDSEEVPRVLNGKGTMIAELTCYVSLVGALLFR